jgi:hypothetical protein
MLERDNRNGLRIEEPAAFHFTLGKRRYHDHHCDQQRGNDDEPANCLPSLVLAVRHRLTISCPTSSSLAERSANDPQLSS